MTTAQKFDKILEVTQLEFNDFAMECKILPNTLKIAIKRDAITSDIITKIHDKFGIRKGFFQDGKEPVLEEKPTPVQNEATVPEKTKEEVYRDLVESNSAYTIIPKTVLDGEYRIVAKSELEQKARELEQRAKEYADSQQERKMTIETLNNYIKRLEEENSELRSKTIATSQKTQ